MPEVGDRRGGRGDDASARGAVRGFRLTVRGVLAHFSVWGVSGMTGGLAAARSTHYNDGR